MRLAEACRDELKRDVRELVPEVQVERPVLLEGQQRLGELGIRQRDLLLVAGDLDSVIQGLLPGFQSWKGRQQGRMNIDNALGKSAQKLTL